MVITVSRTDTVSVAPVRSMIHGDPRVLGLDVRTGADFEPMHIPGSFSVPCRCHAAA